MTLSAFCKHVYSCRAKAASYTQYVGSIMMFKNRKAATPKGTDEMQLKTFATPTGNIETTA